MDFLDSISKNDVLATLLIIVVANTVAILLAFYNSYRSSKLLSKQLYAQNEQYRISELQQRMVHLCWTPEGKIEKEQVRNQFWINISKWREVSGLILDKADVKKEIEKEFSTLSEKMTKPANFSIEDQEKAKKFIARIKNVVEEEISDILEKLNRSF